MKKTIAFALLTVTALAQASVINANSQSWSAPPTSVTSSTQQLVSTAAKPLPTSTTALQEEIIQLRKQVVNLQGVVAIQGHELQLTRLELQNLSLKNKNQQLSQEQLQAVVARQAKTKSASSTAMTATELASSNALYKKAYQMILQKQYSPATTLLQQYIAKYPRGGYAADAHYWLGELYAVAGNSAGAIKQFHVVIKRFPDSARVVDALLKMGVIEESETNYTQAKVWFARVVNQFPNTMASRMANRSLTQLEQAGY